MIIHCSLLQYILITIIYTYVLIIFCNYYFYIECYWNIIFTVCHVYSKSRYRIHVLNYSISNQQEQQLFPNIQYKIEQITNIGITVDEIDQRWYV